MTSLPIIAVACGTHGCRAFGAVRRVRLKHVAMGLVEAPRLLCIGCGLEPQTVQSWPTAVMEGPDMPKITVHGGPSNAGEPQTAEPQTAGPAETPSPPAEPVAGQALGPAGHEAGGEAGDEAPSVARPPFDPNAHTVAEVQEYLQAASEQGDTDEVDRVLEAERAGKARKSLLTS